MTLLFAIAPGLQLKAFAAGTVQVGNEADLDQAVSTAGAGTTTIELTASFPITGTVTIPAVSDIILTSAAGGSYTLARGTAMTGTADVLFLVSGTLELENITLDGNKSNVVAQCSLIHVAGTGALILNNGATLQNNDNNGNIANDQGGAIHGDASSAIEIHEGALVTRNSTDINGETGGGIFTAGRILMDGGTISYNSAINGGGGLNVAGSTPMTFSFTGGCIEYNQAIGAGLTAGIGDGGGIYLSNTTTLTFNMSGSAEISNNTAHRRGGGIGVGAGTIIFNISGGTIHDNTAELGGGGICATSTPYTFNISGGKIYGNKATGTWVGAETDIGLGGAISSLGTFNITGGEISGNYASVGGGAIAEHYLNQAFSVKDCDITGNSTDGNGGAVYFWGQDNTNTVCSPLFTNVNLSGNTAQGRGGAIYNVAGTTVGNPVRELGMHFSQCTISGNKAGLDGGGIYTDWKVSLVSNTQVTGNAADVASSTGAGGGIYSLYSLEMEDGAFANNKADLGGGIYNAAPGSVIVSSGTFTGNTASGPDTTMGSGGAIYTELYANLTVSDGVAFANNSAPSLRVADLIDDDIDSSGTADLAEYVNNIGAIVQDATLVAAMSGPLRNAPGYNNFDINYSGDHYQVTVNNSFAATTGAGFWGSGDRVTINAGSKLGYQFAGWTVNGGSIALADSSAVSTTFVMPSGHVTVTANWVAPQQVLYDGNDSIPPAGDNAAGLLLFAALTAALSLLVIARSLRKKAED